MTIINRAAQAVREELNDYPVDGSWMSEGGVRGEDHYRDIVCAVLAAIRVPSEAMKAAGLGATGGDGAVLDGWESMIDAAIAEAQA